MKYKKGIAGLKQFVQQDHVDEETKKVYQEIIDNLESNQMIYRKLMKQHKEAKKNDINK